MDNASVHKALSQLEEAAEDFELIQSGKGSEKLNGLYKPQEKAIILHNRNDAMQDSAVFLRCAIHQYAHHLCIYGSAAAPVSCPEPQEGIAKRHGSRFNACYHRLLARAREQELLKEQSPWQRDPGMEQLSGELKGDLLPRYGRIVLELGDLYLRVWRRCEEKGFPFGLWLEEESGMDAPEARRMMKLKEEGIRPEPGYEAMKRLVKLPQEERRVAEEAVVSGEKSAKAVEAVYQAPAPLKRNSEDEAQRLLHEKELLEKRMMKIQNRIERLHQRLAEMGEE